MSTSRSLNKAMIIGNLTRSPEVRETGNGSTVVTFGVATNTNWRDSSGESQERTEFHNVVAWNKLGEICAKLLAKGMSVYIEGELRTRTWTDEAGVKHFKTEIKAQDMKILDTKGKKSPNPDLEIGENEQTTEEVDEEVEEAADAQEEANENQKEESNKIKSTGEDLF